VKSYHITLGSGRVVEIVADDIKFMGDQVYKVIGQKWTQIYKKDEVRGVYVKK